MAWADYFREVRPAESFETDHLSDDAIYRLDEEGDEVLGGWSLGRCVIAEIDGADSVYVHTDRSWYRIAEDFAAFVHEAVDQLESGAVTLPPFNDANEPSYNARAAEESGGHLVLMDGEIFRSPSAHGGIEFCDLYGRDGEIIHVKRFHGRSRQLSHLFSQGTVSARTTLADQTFRSRVNDELPTSHAFENPVERIEAREYEVNYAVVAPRGRELELPFFSKVNLKNAADLLQSFGFEVTFTAIDNHVTSDGD